MATHFENCADLRELDPAELAFVSGGGNKDAKGKPAPAPKEPPPQTPPPYFGPGTIITIRF